MTEKQVKQWVKTIAWILLAIVAFLSAAVALNSTRSGAWFLATTVVCFVWFCVSVLRKVSGRLGSVYRYFDVIHRSIFALCIGLTTLIGFLLTEELIHERLGLLEGFILLALALHQGIRGCMMARRRWQSRFDIFNSLQSARKQLQKGPLPKQYDFGFFVMVSILSTVIGRMYGYEYSILAGAILLSLTVPFLLGLIFMSSRLLRIYIIKDEPIELG